MECRLTCSWPGQKKAAELRNGENADLCVKVAAAGEHGSSPRQRQQHDGAACQCAQPHSYLHHRGAIISNVHKRRSCKWDVQ